MIEGLGRFAQQVFVTGGRISLHVTEPYNEVDLVEFAGGKFPRLDPLFDFHKDRDGPVEVCLPQLFLHHCRKVLIADVVHVLDRGRLCPESLRRKNQQCTKYIDKRAPEDSIRGLAVTEMCGAGNGQFSAMERKMYN